MKAGPSPRRHRRFDLAIEEGPHRGGGGIHGYDAIPSTLPGGAMRLVAASETELPEHDLRRALAARGYLEAINYAFVDAGLLATWQADEALVPLANPLSAELGVMRPRLLPGLVDALARNVARQQGRVRLFELGKVHRSVAGSAVETPRIAPGPVAMRPASVVPPWRRVDFMTSRAIWKDSGALGTELAFQRHAPRAHPGRPRRLRDGHWSVRSPNCNRARSRRWAQTIPCGV